MDCGCSLEPPWGGGSNVCPRSVFWAGMEGISYHSSFVENQTLMRIIPSHENERNSNKMILFIHCIYVLFTLLVVMSMALIQFTLTYMHQISNIHVLSIVRFPKLTLYVLSMILTSFDGG